MVPLFGALALIAATAVTGYVTWKIAKRSTSGAIDTSEAGALWTEGTAMRRELRDEVTDLKAQLLKAIEVTAELNIEIRLSRAETESSREETRNSREETRNSREETRRLMDQIAALHVETTHVLDEVKTSNALTIGALADNTESRRIMDIPAGDRTAQETEHLATAHDRLPDDQRAKEKPDE